MSYQTDMIRSVDLSKYYLSKWHAEQNLLDHFRQRASYRLLKRVRWIDADVNGFGDMVRNPATISYSIGPGYHEIPDRSPLGLAMRSAVCRNALEALLSSVHAVGFAGRRADREWGLYELLNHYLHVPDLILREMPKPKEAGPIAYAWHNGLWAFWVQGEEAIAISRPIMRTNDRGQLHSYDRPAMEWPGGPRYWFVNGVLVPDGLMEHPEEITVERIDSIENAEVRRVAMNLYHHGQAVSGPSAYLHDADAEVVDDDPRYGRLLRRGLGLATVRAFVEVTNSTPEPDGTVKKYVLRVPPHMRTAHEAVAWTFGLTADEYCPETET